MERRECCQHLHLKHLSRLSEPLFLSSDTKTQIFTANILNWPFLQQKYKGATQVHTAAIKIEKKEDKPPLPPFFPADIKGKKILSLCSASREGIPGSGNRTKARYYLSESAEQGHPKSPNPGGCSDPKTSPSSLRLFRSFPGFPGFSSGIP